MPEHFVVKIPDAIDLEKAGPLLCAGITMYDPLRHWGATNTDKKMTVGIIGVGGLGTMGIKLVKALGQKCVAITSTKAKEALAKEKGADTVIFSTDEESMKAGAASIDLMINTVPVPQDCTKYLPLLAQGGTIVQLGYWGEPHMINQMTLIGQRKGIAGSLIGGIKATEEMLEFCAKNNIMPDIELINANKIEDVFAKLAAGNSDTLRYVVDITKSKADKDFMPAM